MQDMSLSPQSTSRMQQLALTYNLGTPQGEYKTKYGRISAFFGMLWMLYILILILVVFFFAISPADRAPWIWLAALVFVSLILLGMWGFLSMLIAPHITVILCSEGLLHIKKGQTEAIRWEQVTSFWKDISTSSESRTPDTYQYRIQRNDDMEFEIPDALEQRKDVGTYIERKITPLLLAQAQTMYDAGTPLTFGEITIDAQEIHVGHGRKTLAWNDVGSIKLDEERILIYQQGRKNVWYHQRVAHIPNVQVFKELVDSILQTHARQQFPHILSVYSSGTPITFGRLSLDQQGVTIDGGRKFLPWSQVQDIKVDMSTQKISIEAKGKVVNWQTVSTTEIPDVPVLQQLVAHILYKNQQQTRTHIDNELPHIISSYTAGIPVSFGRVSFSLQGIAVDGGKQFLPWSEITSFYIRTYIGGDRLTIVKKGKMLAWQALRTSELGDVDLLQNFIDYLKDTQQ